MESDIDLEGQTAPPDYRNARIVIVGSGPSAPAMAKLVDSGATIVAVNNAWRATPRFDYFVFPSDFPVERRPSMAGAVKRSIGTRIYKRGYDDAGGILFGGATMAFAAGYWAMRRFKGAQIAFLASDMHYGTNGAATHFYGTGQPDPLRVNISLQSLEASSCRMFYKAIAQGTLLINATHEDQTRLTLPRVPYRQLGEGSLVHEGVALYRERYAAPAARIAAEAESMEAAAPFEARTSKYLRYRRDREVWQYVGEVNAKWLQLSDIIGNFGQDISKIK